METSPDSEKLCSRTGCHICTALWALSVRKSDGTSEILRRFVAFLRTLMAVPGELGCVNEKTAGDISRTLTDLRNTVCDTLFRLMYKPTFILQSKPLG
jgi:hypothetical protein